MTNPLDVIVEPDTPSPAEAIPGRHGGWSHAKRVIRSSFSSSLGIAIVLVVLVVTVAAPWIVPHDPEQTFAGRLQPPSREHLFGTDSFGLDVFSRVVAATRTDIPIAFTATIAAMVIGVAFGVLTGYFGNRRGIGGAASEVVMRTTDILQAFPVFVLALVLVAATGPSAVNVGIAIAFVNTPVFLRLVRSQVLGRRDMAFVEAARCSGAPPMRIAFRNILPGVISPAVIQASVTMGFAILLTAGLSFIGAGVPQPTPEWGLMIASGSRDMITGQWWTSVFPGAALAITILGFALTGEALGRIADPLQRR